MSLLRPICNVGGVCADLFFFFSFFLSCLFSPLVRFRASIYIRLPLRPNCAGNFPEKERKLSKKKIEFCFFVYNRSTCPLQFLRRHCTLRISVMMVSVTMSLRRLPDEYTISMTRHQLLSRGPFGTMFFFWYIVRSLLP